ncbi:MAG: phytanoyl-CoA dioxygenase family protein [Steroidobacteraceae bacterium]
MPITPEQLATYQRDGAVRLPGAFASWVAPLRDAVLEVIETARRSGLPARATHLNPATVIEDFGGGAMALNIFPHHPEFARWLACSPAAQMTAAIMQSTRSRFWVDASFLKDQPAASDGTPWHNDTCTWPFWGRQMTILWIALSDVDPGNAPLTTVRGSHAGDGRYYSTFFPQDQPPPPGYRPWSELLAQAEAPDADIQVWTLRPGDCLFMHPNTIHGSRPRTARQGEPRLAFSTRWLGDDVVWKPDALTARMTSALNDHPAMVFGAAPPDALLPAQWPPGAAPA